MKLITINPNNEPYYSEDFIKGFKCGAQRQLEADKVDMPTWIPCSERLPKEYGKYLVTAKILDNIVTEINVFDDEEQRWCWVGKILAWMPLPEPWKGTDE